MTQDASIIELAQWLQTPAGRYLLAWEQQRLDAAVTDVFGFHALQLGCPEVAGLDTNRMPHRWRAVDHTGALPLMGSLPDPAAGTSAVVLRCDFDALPFPNASLDLVVLPHALELARDPHAVL